MIAFATGMGRVGTVFASAGGTARSGFDVAVAGNSFVCVCVCVCGRVPFNDQLQQPRQIGRDLCVDWKHNDVRLFLLLLPPASGRLVSLPLPHKEIKMKYLLLLIFSFYSAPHFSEVKVVDQGLAQPHLPPGRVINASPSKCR